MSLKALTRALSCLCLFATPVFADLVHVADTEYIDEGDTGIMEGEEDLITEEEDSELLTEEEYGEAMFDEEGNDLAVADPEGGAYEGSDGNVIQ